MKHLMKPSRIAPITFFVVSTGWALGARPAAADALALVAPGAVARVVPAGTGVAVLRAGAVTMFDGDGSVVGSCPRAPATPASTPRRDRTARAADEILREAGMSEWDEAPEAEELLDDEGGAAARRRPRRADDGTMPRALDVGGTPDAAWIGTTDGLWRWDAGTARCARVDLRGRAVQRVAAARDAVAAVSDDVVWRGGRDGRLQVAGGLTSRARALALADDGTLLAGDDEALREVGPARAVRTLLERPVAGLVACGPVVVALAGDGVYRVNGADVERLGPPPPVRALACAARAGGVARLVGAGVGLWASGDGAAWLEDELGLGRSFSDVAFAAGRIWVGADGGLFTPTGEGGAPELLLPEPVAAVRGPGAPPLWASLLPTVAVAVDDWAESKGRRGWRAWLLVTVTLDRHGWARAAEDVP